LSGNDGPRVRVVTCANVRRGHDGDHAWVRCQDDRRRIYACGGQVSRQEETAVRTTILRSATIAVAAIAVLGIAGCAVHEQVAAPGAGASVSYDDPPTTAEVADHNQADVTYVTSAVLLRQQAVEIANLATSTGTRPALSALAGLAMRIAQDQQPSLPTLSGLLAKWGQPTPSAADTSGQVAGLIADSDIASLKTATGTAFSTLWVHDMTANLTAALNAANSEQTSGTSAAAKQVATDWATELQSELSTLKSLG
jgi:uncharacterized protein (DUF305 family)